MKKKYEVDIEARIRVEVTAYDPEEAEELALMMIYPIDGTLCSAGVRSVTEV